MSMNGQSKPVDAAVGGPVFADSAGAPQVIASLPLAEGYSTTFRNFDLQKQKPQLMQLKVTGVESVQFRLEPGDMIVFNSGRLLHRVTPVIGAAKRWTACSFMSEGRDGDVLCWG